MNQPEARIARVIRHVIWVGITAHAGFIPLFAWLGYPLLAGFNVFGVICWAAAGLTNRRGHCTAAMWLLTGEVTLHAVVAAQALGWASGFQYYLIPLIPFVMFNERLRARVALGVGVLLLSAFVGLYLTVPAIVLDTSVNRPLSIINIVIPLLALGSIAFHFRLASMDVEQTVAALAATDPLTGLANRRHMTQRLREEESRAARAHSTFCVILADIDHFKRINDTSGHDVGDRVLVDLAGIFAQTLRAQDIVARWGGEEFLVMLPETKLPAAWEVAERLRRAVETHRFSAGADVGTVTVTLGVAEYDSSLSACLKLADDALYYGKANGRNRVVTGPAETPAYAGN